MSKWDSLAAHDAPRHMCGLETKPSYFGGVVMPLKEPPFVRVFSLRPVCLTLECDFHFKAL